MSVAKSSSGRRASKRSGKSPADTMLTTAFMVDAGARLPKGSAGFTIRVPSKAHHALTSEPARVKPLLWHYTQAVIKSREAGRPVSFRVEVDPTGGATVTPMRAVVTEPSTVTAETPRKADDQLEAALVAARHRGRHRVAEILSGPEMLTADAFAELIGTSRVTVNSKRQTRQVLGLDGAKRGYRFPEWQVGEDGKPFAAIPELFRRLADSPWAVYRFLVQHHPELDGQTGRDALRRGQIDAVLEAAESVGRGDFA